MLWRIYSKGNQPKDDIKRNQLKNVKIQNLETMQSYFTRVAQIKEQLEAIEEKVE